jgi:hypothetical protein
VLLGLPAALLAHAFVFGHRHAAAGAAHNAVLAGALLAVSLVLALQTRAASQGSILARRLHDGMPGFFAIAVSAGAWYALIELSEPHHAFSAITAAAALLAASLFVRGAIRFTARSLSTIAIAFTARLRPGRGLESRVPPQRTLPLIKSFALSRRLFSRPPPAFS